MFRFADDYNVVVGQEPVIALGHRVNVFSIFDGNNIDVVLLADVDFNNGLSHPFGDNRDFKDLAVGRQFNIVENICRIVPHGKIFRDFPFREKDFIRSDFF